MANKRREYLVKLRKELKLTQTEIAEKLGVNSSYMGDIEQGRRKPSVDMLERLADFYNVSTDYILGRSKEKLVFNKLTDYELERIICSSQLKDDVSRRALYLVSLVGKIDDINQIIALTAMLLKKEGIDYSDQLLDKYRKYLD